jgi:hypothetical protein
VGHRWENEYGNMFEWYWQGKNKLVKDTAIPLPLCPEQTVHRLACDCTLVAAFKPWRNTANVMAQPLKFKYPAALNIRHFSFLLPNDFIKWLHTPTLSYIILITNLPSLTHHKTKKKHLFFVYNNIFMTYGIIQTKFSEFNR